MIPTIVAAWLVLFAGAGVIYCLLQMSEHDQEAVLTENETEEERSLDRSAW